MVLIDRLLIECLPCPCDEVQSLCHGLNALTVNEEGRGNQGGVRQITGLKGKQEMLVLSAK